ncbi:MAG: DUF362 domain-containing protein [PVC group bacterium]|nr:DUF362 domain-containing protein [PVC group bacterium]
MNKQDWFRKKFSRKQFLQLLGAGAGFLASENILLKAALAFSKSDTSPGRKKGGLTGNYDLVSATGENPYQMTVKAIKAMGGMKKFVNPGSVVLIKPNIAWDRTPEQAANTNPEVVAALIDLCLQSGAKRVNVFDSPCNNAQRTYQNSGIEKIAKEHGANVFFANTWNVVRAKFPYESPMQDWPVFREALECDTFINVPVMKHHRLTKLTLSMKNLMGVCSGNRGNIHTDIGRKLVDITTFINPDLTVIDAYRVLVRNGPVGGNLDDVVYMKQLLIGTDPTLTDAYASTLLDIDPLTVPYIQNAIDRGIGSIDFKKANILKITA